MSSAFFQVVKTWCQNRSFAGSENSYEVFAPLFDRILESHHKHKLDAKIVSSEGLKTIELNYDMDHNKLNFPPLLEEYAE